jgi:hypothetical protein
VVDAYGQKPLAETVMTMGIRSSKQIALTDD